MNIPKISALYESSLASSLSAAGSSFTVVNGNDRDGNALSGLYGFIIDEGSADEEFVIGTIATSVVTISYRGIDADAPNTEITANKKAHRRGASVKITDYPIMGVLRNILNGDDTLPNAITYANAVSPTPGSKQLASVAYAESLANAGAATSSTSTKGIIKVSTTPVDPVNPIAVGDNDTRIPTASEKSAMAGSAGTPGASNLFLTQASVTDAAIDQSQTTQNSSLAVGEADATSKKNLLAQSFIPTKAKIRGVKLYKSADSGTFTGTVKVALQADSAGSPSGSDLASVTLTNALWLAIPAGEFSAIFSTEYSSITVGNTYWIVITPSTSDTTNHPNIGDNTAGGYANGSTKYKNTTDGWTAIATVDLYFKTIEGITSRVPTTGTSSLIPREMGMASYLKYVDATGISVSGGGSTAEQTLATIQLYPDELRTLSGIKVRFGGTGNASNTGNDHTLTTRFKLNGTTIATLALIYDTTQTGSSGYFGEALIYFTGALTTQGYSANAIGNGGFLADTYIAIANGTGAVDCSAGAVLTVTFQVSNTSNFSSSLTNVSVEVLR